MYKNVLGSGCLANTGLFQLFKIQQFSQLVRKHAVVSARQRHLSNLGPWGDMQTVHFC